MPVTYGNSYVYPDWAECIGLGLCLSSMMWIPGYAAYYLLFMPGTIIEVGQNCYVTNTILRMKVDMQINRKILNANCYSDSYKAAPSE